MAGQVELYEGSGGTAGLTFKDMGLPVIIVAYCGWKTFKNNMGCTAARH
jgi:hypothetical protein